MYHVYAYFGLWSLSNYYFRVSTRAHMNPFYTRYPKALGDIYSLAELYHVSFTPLTQEGPMMVVLTYTRDHSSPRHPIYIITLE